VTAHAERFEIIAAFADGERVETEALRAALSDEAGRDYLIDLVAMREVVGAADDRPAWTAAPHRAAERKGRGFVGLAAVVTLAVGLAGYAVGQQRSQVVSVAVRPPLEADVIVAVEAPPAPTQVIPLGQSVADRGGR
jgi:hypothetical protein